MHVACHDAERTELRVAILGGQKLEPWSPGTVSPRRSSAGSSPARKVSRSVSCARMASSRARPVRRAVAHDPRLRPRRGRHGADPRRNRLGAEPRGDLLQAGPLLVADGDVAYDPELDIEGFRAGAHQFDPDPTEGRHPRAALGLADGRIVAVACDGRSRRDAGLTLVELARLMVALGCEYALNLDGGGSTALISGGRLQNLPRGDFEVPEPGGRPIATALEFRPI